MTYFVIIRGPAGIGKSTISELLARKIKAKVIHFDRKMDKANLVYIPGEKWIPLHKFLKADKIIAPKVKIELKNGKNIVFDGNFYHKEQIKDLIKRLNSKHFIFTLKANLKECIKRDKARKKYLGRKPISDVFKLVSKFDYGTKIDTEKKTENQVIKDILSYLPNEN
jgi:predicted kinase